MEDPRFRTATSSATAAAASPTNNVGRRIRRAFTAVSSTVRSSLLTASVTRLRGGDGRQGHDRRHQRHQGQQRQSRHRGRGSSYVGRRHHRRVADADTVACSLSSGGGGNNLNHYGGSSGCSSDSYGTALVCGGSHATPPPPGNDVHLGASGKDSAAAVVAASSASTVGSGPKPHASHCGSGCGSSGSRSGCSPKYHGTDGGSVDSGLWTQDSQSSVLERQVFTLLQLLAGLNATTSKADFEMAVRSVLRASEHAHFTPVADSDGVVRGTVELELQFAIELIESAVLLHRLDPEEDGDNNNDNNAGSMPLVAPPAKTLLSAQQSFGDGDNSLLQRVNDFCRPKQLPPLNSSRLLEHRSSFHSSSPSSAEGNSLEAIRGGSGSCGGYDDDGNSNSSCGTSAYFSLAPTTSMHALADPLQPNEDDDYYLDDVRHGLVFIENMDFVVGPDEDNDDDCHHHIRHVVSDGMTKRKSIPGNGGKMK